MAKEAFMVLFRQQSAGLGLDGLNRTYTKAEAETLDPRLKEISILKGPAMKCNYIEVEAESASQAAILVRKALAPTVSESPKFITVKAAEFVETASQ